MITMRDMVQAGVHFGHRTRYCNPKMTPYIYSSHNKIHIIDLEKTLPAFEEALAIGEKMAAKNQQILFVGTKRAAQAIVKEQAIRCDMPYVNERWLGGTLTNYRTVRQSVQRLKDLEARRDAGDFNKLTKKETLHYERQIAKLEKNVGGIRNMEGLPDALFVVDVDHERIAVAEANRLKVPVIAVVDTNSDPGNVQHVIPGNDDAICSVTLYATAMAEAVQAGLTQHAGQPAFALASKVARTSQAEEEQPEEEMKSEFEFDVPESDLQDEESEGKL